MIVYRANARRELTIDNWSVSDINSNLQISFFFVPLTDFVFYAIFSTLKALTKTYAHGKILREAFTLEQER